MKMLKRRKIEEYLAELRHYVDGMDTPREVRATVGYTFVISLTDALTELNMHPDVAAKAASVTTAILPDNFHEEYPEQFAEIVRLYAKQLFVLWRTCLSDYSDEVYEDVFMELAKRNEIRLEL